MAEYWSPLLTEKSWKLLQELRRKYKFVLIGGWAVHLLTKQLKSRDIDIVVSINELQKLKEEGLNKNDRLKKYEIKKEECDVDIYVEHYSNLAIPTEDIKNYIIKIEGFDAAAPELLLILKQAAYVERENSTKGEKDKLDIISLLLFSDIDFKKYHNILEKYKLNEYRRKLITLIKSFKEPERLNINPREFKKRKERILRLI